MKRRELGLAAQQCRSTGCYLGAACRLTVSLRDDEPEGVETTPPTQYRRTEHGVLVTTLRVLFAQGKEQTALHNMARARNGQDINQLTLLLFSSCSFPLSQSRV
jgi:hypothetical protein